MTKLGVNIDHVATIRQARRAVEPDPVAAAALAELAGADGITVHLRADRRHISDRDVRLLRRTVKTRLNMEMAATEEMIAIALEVQPDMVTLVPERPDEITTEGGLDVEKHADELAPAIQELKSGGLEISLFIDPEERQITRVSDIQGGIIELNTNAYAEAVPKGLNEDDKSFQRELKKITRAAQFAESLGMRTLAGHGLTYRNVGPISRVPQIVELNIGHNIVSRAVLVGMERAVREMLEAMR